MRQLKYRQDFQVSCAAVRIDVCFGAPLPQARAVVCSSCQIADASPKAKKMKLQGLCLLALCTFSRDLETTETPLGTDRLGYKTYFLSRKVSRPCNRDVSPRSQDATGLILEGWLQGSRWHLTYIGMSWNAPLFRPTWQEYVKMLSQILRKFPA